jgi:hypothetical protein
MRDALGVRHAPGAAEEHGGAEVGRAPPEELGRAAAREVGVAVVVEVPDGVDPARHPDVLCAVFGQRRRALAQPPGTAREHRVPPHVHRVEIGAPRLHAPLLQHRVGVPVAVEVARGHEGHRLHLKPWRTRRSRRHWTLRGRDHGVGPRAPVAHPHPRGGRRHALLDPIAVEVGEGLQAPRRASRRRDHHRAHRRAHEPVRARRGPTATRSAGRGGGSWAGCSGRRSRPPPPRRGCTRGRCSG